MINVLWEPMKLMGFVSIVCMGVQTVITRLHVINVYKDFYLKVNADSIVQSIWLLKITHV